MVAKHRFHGLYPSRKGALPLKSPSNLAGTSYWFWPVLKEVQLSDKLVPMYWKPEWISQGTFHAVECTSKSWLLPKVFIDSSDRIDWTDSVGESSQDAKMTQKGTEIAGKPAEDQHYGLTHAAGLKLLSSQFCWGLSLSVFHQSPVYPVSLKKMLF